ncbi:PQQ-dependent sugar dehydrogenase [Microbacterium sp. NPDC019599]|uniref:PQQ-dependent sugar dehydrogenase n=1 Tax=Microbacterium sp. NPDC019599 TaxID=3154690 RepID=UPI0033DA9D49
MSGRRRAAAAAVLVAALMAVSACTAQAPEDSIPPPATRAETPAPRGTDVPTGFWRAEGEPVTLASGLRAPWSVAPLPGGGALISQRGDGTVLELTPEGELRTAGTVPGVVSGGESGLHGLALWEDDGERWLYAYHGAADDNRVVRMPLLGGDGDLSLGEPEVILSGIARNSTHDGGRLAFGPDGLLYVTTGDAQNRPSAQDPASLGGKILRLTPQGDPAPGNPFGTAVYSLGHRNVQGIAWTSDGTMWASEFGQDTFDELNRIEAGANYGWPVYEGTSGDERYADPVVTWTTDEASPSGIAAVGETVFIASLRGERLWTVDTDAPGIAAEPVAALAGEQGRLRDAVAAPDGTLWVLTNNTDGRGSPREGDDVLLQVALAPHG